MGSPWATLSWPINWWIHRSTIGSCGSRASSLVGFASPSNFFNIPTSAMVHNWHSSPYHVNLFHEQLPRAACSSLSLIAAWPIVSAMNYHMVCRSAYPGRFGISGPASDSVRGTIPVSSTDKMKENKELHLLFHQNLMPKLPVPLVLKQFGTAVTVPYIHTARTPCLPLLCSTSP